MKDNKYAPYILGPILLLIWGLIFYKIYQAVYGNGEEFKVPSYGALPVFEQVQQDSGYALLLNYRDPFLGKKFHYNSSSQGSTFPRTTAPARGNNSRRTNPAPIKKQASTPPQNFPPIIYQGYQILDTDTIALLKINGKFYPTARKGAVLQGVEVQGIYKDSVQVGYGESQQVIIKRGQ